MSGRAVRLFDARQGLEVGNVQAIVARGGDVWAGGELGLARFDGTRFVVIHNASGAAFNGISGIVTARNGDLWLNGMSGITHIARQELERAVRDAAYPVQCETFDYLDGVPGTAVQLRPLPSAVETTDGHIWFSMSAGIVSIDAANLVHNTLAPPVTIWSLTSGGRRYPHLGAGLLLPVHTANLQIEYSAGSLTVLSSSLAHNRALGHDGEGGADGGDGLGGGLYIAGGTASILTTTINHNRALGGDDAGSNGGNGLGGGVYVATGTVLVVVSEISYNQAFGGFGDGDGTDGQGVGGGVYNLGTFLFDALTVIDHNHASDSYDDCFGC